MPRTECDQSQSLELK